MFCWDGANSHWEAMLNLDLSGNIPVYDLVDRTVTTLADLKDDVQDMVSSYNTIKASHGQMYLLNYYCSGGYGDNTPEAIYIVGKDASMIRVNGVVNGVPKDTAQLIWRPAPGEVAFGTPVKTETAGGTYARSWTIYGTSVVEGLKDCYTIYHYATDNGQGTDTKGLYNPVVEADGTLRLAYVTPAALRGQLDESKTVIVSGPSGAATVAEINAKVAAGWTVTASTVQASNGKTYVYVTAVTEP